MSSSIVSLWIVVVFVSASELAFHVGRKAAARHDENLRAQLLTAQAALLGLFALMLGFTLSMADSRFNARRQVVLAEAAAVGTTYLRAEFLPEPTRTQSRDLLRAYVQARRDYFRAGPSEAAAATARSQQLHAQLWASAMLVAPDALDSPLVAIYLDSLNRMIDLEAARAISIDARLPWTIPLLVVVIAVVAIGASAYVAGLGGRRVTLTVTVSPLLIAFACWTLLDLDRSRFGIIGTGDAPMARLERSMLGERAAIGH